MELEFHGASGAEGEIIDDHKAGDDLRKGGGSGGTGNAPAQHIDGNGIENDVQNAAGDGTEHHPPGAAVHSDEHTEAVGGGIEECADQHHPHIGHGVGHYLVACAEQPEQGLGKGIAQGNQDDVLENQQQKAVIEDGFCILTAALTQSKGQEGRTAGAHQHGKGVDDADGGMTDRGGGDAQLTYKVSYKRLVYNIIETADEHHGDGRQGVL